MSIKNQLQAKQSERLLLAYLIQIRREICLATGLATENTCTIGDSHRVSFYKEATKHDNIKLISEVYFHSSRVLPAALFELRIEFGERYGTITFRGIMKTSDVNYIGHVANKNVIAEIIMEIRRYETTL